MTDGTGGFETVVERPPQPPVDVDYVVVGLGALGSGAAWHLASRGHSVVGLEQFELGHSRGASHDTSRILRHSYHTPAYVRLTQEAYDDWARLEDESGESLVTVVGGLDLFPPDCVIAPDDYVASMREVGIDFESLTAEEIAVRFPVFSVPDGTLGLFQERGAIVPGSPGHGRDAAARHRGGRDACTDPPRSPPSPTTART